MKADPALPRTFCVLPWIHRFTNIGGEIQVCCTSEEHENNILSDSGKKMLSPEVSSDSVIMNSNFMKKLRLQLLNGEWPELCRRCEVTEQADGISRRNSENYNYRDEVSTLIGATEDDGTIPVNIRSVDFRLGNFCNLSCIMCSPSASSRWQTEVFKHDFSLMFGRNDPRPNTNWYESKDIDANFREITKDIQHLHFAGGEPLINPKMPQFLRICAENGHAKNITVTYNTNLTKISSEIKELWTEFKAVKVWASVDAYGKLNELIRHGSHWPTIDKNLRDLELNHQRYNVAEVEVMCTVQSLNVMSLGELYDYLGENFRFVSPLPKLIELHYPDYFRTQVLPPNLKNEARSYLEKVLTKAEKRIQDGIIPDRYRYFLDSLRGTINFLSLSDQSHLYPQFVQIVESVCKVRGHKLDLTHRVIPKSG